LKNVLQESTSPNLPQYYSPSRVEPDHKDMIISQLKAEISDLQQREMEYHEAIEQLKILEDKIDALRQERVIN